jgi:hypothetical protein
VVLGLLALLVLASLSTLVGPRTARVSASAGGYRLSVTFPAMSRPGLAIRWIAEVDHPGGFQSPVVLATDSGYFNLFDFNNLDPTPDSTTTEAARSIWTFTAPPGDVFRVTMDGRVEPAQQLGKSTTTTLQIQGGPPISVHYTTSLSP